MELINEYLVIIDKKTSSALYKLCTSSTEFNRLLIAGNNNLEIKKGKVYINKVICKYKIKFKELKEKSQKFFFIELVFNQEEELLKNFSSLLDYINYTLNNDGAEIEILRDDVSFYYSQIAYSKIYKIENLMRKFITFFMITNVGKNWIDESSPLQIQKTISSSNETDKINKLQNLDFIQLGEILFDTVKKNGTEQLPYKLKEMHNNGEDIINLNDILKYIPYSNWDKYFNAIVDCNEKYLKDLWQELYKLRNKIAHTSNFTKENFEDTLTYTSTIESILTQALQNIDLIELNTEEKEELSENIAINLNHNIGEFISEWNQYEKTIKSIYKIQDNDKNKFFLILNNLIKKDFDQNTFNEINLLREYRNNIVHNIDDIDQENIMDNIKKIKAILFSTWKIQVLKAFHDLGGEAKLKEIYNHIKNTIGRDLTLSDESSIRKAIYFHSSNVDLYQGKEDLFEKLGNGKWKLRDIKNPAP